MVCSCCHLRVRRATRRVFVHQSQMLPMVSQGLRLGHGVVPCETQRLEATGTPDGAINALSQSVELWCASFVLADEGKGFALGCFLLYNNRRHGIHLLCLWVASDFYLVVEPGPFSCLKTAYVLGLIVPYFHQFVNIFLHHFGDLY